MALHPRAPTRDDAEPVRRLVEHVLAGSPYTARTLEIATESQREGGEHRGMVVDDNGIVAVAFFGPIAGSQGTWRLSALLLAHEIEPRAAGEALVTSVVAEARREGGRLLVAELPADPVMGRTLSLLRALEFKQEARIPDFFRDGVALLMLRRELA